MKRFSDIQKKANKTSWTYEEIVHDIKSSMGAENKSIATPLNRVLASCPKDRRLDFVLNLIKKSRYKTYTLAMKNFLKEIEDFRLKKSSERHLENYIDRLIQGGVDEPTFRGFLEIQRLVISDVLYDDASKSSWAIQNINDNMNKEEHNKYIIGVISDLAEMLWNNGKALRVMYGA